MPKPHNAYKSRSWSTMTSTFHAPPILLTHSAVASGVQCDIAMKWMDVCLLARTRRRTKSFSATIFWRKRRGQMVSLCVVPSVCPSPPFPPPARRSLSQTTHQKNKLTWTAAKPQKQQYHWSSVCTWEPQLAVCLRLFSYPRWFADGVLGRWWRRPTLESLWYSPLYVCKVACLGSICTVGALFRVSTTTTTAAAAPEQTIGFGEREVAQACFAKGKLCAQ